MAILIFTAIQTLLAVSYDQAILMAAAVIVFFLGLFLDYMLSFIPFPTLQALIQIFIPNWQTYWLSDYIAGNIAVPVTYLLSCFFHALAQVTLFLLVAARIFRKKEYFGGF